MKIGNKTVGGDGTKPYIIAELCNNFNSSIVQAINLILTCAKAGVDACKFQMRIADDRISVKQHESLREFCKKMEVEYLCTAYDGYGLEILRDMNVQAIKIGSAECKNIDFIKAAKKLWKPLIISTGGCEFKDVETICHYADILMHTTSIYPTPYDKVNLGMISRYQLCALPSIIGFSDHTPTIYTAIGAMALGAKVIEKHVTFDKEAIGPDHASSITPDELKQICEAADALKYPTDYTKRCYPEELLKLKKWRN